MGNAVSFLSDGTIDQYVESKDSTNWSFVSFDKVRASQGFKNNVQYNFDGASTMSGKVAQFLVNYALEARCKDEVTSFDQTNPILAHNIPDAFDDIIQQLTNTNCFCMKLKHDHKALIRALYSGYPVAVALPVTMDVMERKLVAPGSGDDLFARVPVVIWGYSKSRGVFYAYVPHKLYEKQPVLIPFSHVMHKNTLDILIVDVLHKPVNDQTEEEEFTGFF